MLKISKPLLYMLLATFGIAAYLMTSSTTPTKKAKKTARPVVTVHTSDADYVDADYTAHFDKPILISRNAFNPLVVRKSSQLAAALAAAGNIPAEFAGGDPNWSCTGSATVDGVLQVLIENKNSGDGVFLKQGDHWKTSVVSQVMEDGVVLVGPGGEPKTIHVKQDTTPEQMDLSGTMPVEPQLSGTIGNGASIQPSGQGAAMPPLPSVAPATTTIQTDDNNEG